MNSSADNLRGAALMSVCMAGYGINDAMMKLASTEVSFFQALLVRGLFATALIGLFAWRRGVLRARIPRADRLTVAWRIVGEVGGTYCFLQALFNMPIANATAILQSMPLAVTLAAALFLREPVGWRRYSAILAGFAGVMVIVRPGTEGFDAHSLWALAAVCFIVLRDLSTRRLSAAVPSAFVALVTAICITLMGALFAPTEPWRPIGAGEIALLGGAACFLVTGYVSSVAAMRVGDIGFISPFRYTILIWAIVSGIVVFGHYPDRWTLIGAAIVVSTGIYTFYRERRVAGR